jgi:hypothetical protein
MAVVASISQQIWDMKYRLKGPSGGPLLVAFILNDPGQLTQMPGGSVGTLAFAGAFVTVGVWVARRFFKIEIPAELAAPLTTIVIGICSGIQIFESFLLPLLMH